jgi:hypothetical protein
LLGVNQPKISALRNYRLSGFSVERLLNFLNALGRDVEIIIRRRRSGTSTTRVIAQRGFDRDAAGRSRTAMFRARVGRRSA